MHISYTYLSSCKRFWQMCMFVSIEKSLLFFILFYSINGISKPLVEPNFVNNENMKHVSVNKHGSYILDNSRQLTLEDVMKPSVNFTALSDKPWQSTNAISWIKLPVHNSKVVRSKSYLFTGLSNISLLNAYLVVNNHSQSLISINGQSTLAQRPVKNGMLYIPISLEPSSNATLYIQYETKGDVSLSLEWFDQKSYHEHSQQQEKFVGIITGILASTLLLVLLQLTVRRQKSLYYLALFICSGLLNLSIMSGQVYYFAKSMTVYQTDFLVSLSIFLPPLFFFAFISRALKLKDFIPSLYKTYQVLICAIALVLVVDFYSDTVTLVQCLMFIMICTILVSIYLFLKRKLFLARLFCVNLVFHLMFFNFLFMIEISNIELFRHVHLFTMPWIGFVLEALMFIIIISYRNKMMANQYQDSLIERLNESKERIAAVKDKNRVLADKQRKILEFATVTHDLTQPVASLKMSMQVIKQQFKHQLDDNLSEHIDKSIYHTEAMLNNIIDTARGEYLSELSHHKINTLLMDIVERFSLRAGNKNIDLSFISTSCVILCDQLLLARIFDNLVANAINNMHGGRIVIGVRRMKNGLKIQVIDNGPGIASLEIQKLTQPFKRTDREVTTKRGFGLGGFIVKQLCDQAGYKLDIVSTLKKGSCFSIVIPASLVIKN